MSDLDHLPPLRDVIAAHDLKAQKSLGQNFILDQNVTDKIVREAGDVSSATVFEIGPGPGGLTRSLLKAGAEKVFAIEFDSRAVAALEELQQAAQGRLNILEGDALDMDLLSLGPPPRMVVANLPYNIATPLLVGWLQQIRTEEEAFQSITIMVQKEVAQRIVSAPGGKTYGRLSVLCQWLCDTRILFDLPPSAFTPPPKVHSSIIRLVPKVLQKDWPDFEAVENVTKAAFGQRRKMIRSSLKTYSEAFVKLGINPESRAENLSVEDFLNLAKA